MRLEVRLLDWQLLVLLVCWRLKANLLQQPLRLCFGPEVLLERYWFVLLEVNALVLAYKLSSQIPYEEL